MCIAQTLYQKYPTNIASFIAKNPRLKNFSPPNRILAGPLKIVSCQVSLYNVEDEKAFLPFIEYLVIQNSDLLEVFYEAPLRGNVRILRIENNERLESALWALVSFFGDAFQISVCVLQLDVEGPALSNIFLVNEFLKEQKVFSDVKVKLDETNNKKISSILLLGKNLGKNSRWKIFSPAKNVMRYELSLRNEELQEINEIYQRKSGNIPFHVFFFKSVSYLNKMYYRKAFFLVDSYVTSPLLKKLDHIKLRLNDLIVFHPFLLGSCKKKHFRFLWAFYSLCCRQYWSFDFPPEVFCSSNSDYFDEKNPFMISFYLSDFLHQVRLTNQNKNRKFAVEFFQDLNSCVETETSEENEYFPFSKLLVDCEIKRNKDGIFFKIKIDSKKFFEFFTPLSLSSIGYRTDIWVEFLKYGQQNGFSEKELNFYMQQFFIFFTYLSVKHRYYGFFEAFPFIELKNFLDPVVKNSKESKENKNKIYLTIICFLLEYCLPDFVLLSDKKVILSPQELLSQPVIPFSKICLINRY